MKRRVAMLFSLPEGRLDSTICEEGIEIFHENRSHEKIRQ